MDNKYDPELMRRLREDDDSILCLAAADVIERQDAEIERLEHHLAQAEALIEIVRAERRRLREGNMRLCVIINENTPDGARECTVDLLEQGVEWLCGELHRLLALARELKAELDGGQKP